MSIGTLFGALLGAYSADWLGRRKNLTLGVFIFIIGNILQITAMNSWVHMMIGRMVAGVGVGILSVGVPLFMSETSPKVLASNTDNIRINSDAAARKFEDRW
jgi:SP family sugar:H+ symporter-like MFS transporter